MNNTEQVSLSTLFRTRLLQGMDAVTFRVLVRELLAAPGESATFSDDVVAIGFDLSLATEDGMLVARCDLRDDNRAVMPGDLRDFLGAMCHVNARVGYYVTTGSFAVESQDFAGAHTELTLIDGYLLGKALIARMYGFVGRTWLTAYHGNEAMAHTASDPVQSLKALIAFDTRIAALNKAGNIPGIKSYLFEILAPLTMVVHRALDETRNLPDLEAWLAQLEKRVISLKDEEARLRDQIRESERIFLPCGMTPDIFRPE